MQPTASCRPLHTPVPQPYNQVPNLQATMQRLALRTPVAARGAPCAPPARAALAARRAVRARATAVDEPAHVAEARQWVERWQARQAAGGAAGGTAAGAAAAAEAAAAAAAPGPAKMEACRSFSDGTLLFTADRLKSVNFDDVKL